MVKSNLLTSVMQALIAITTNDLFRFCLTLFILFKSYKSKNGIVNNPFTFKVKIVLVLANH